MGDIFFSTKTQATITALTRFDLDTRFIYKFHVESLNSS